MEARIRGQILQSLDRVNAGEEIMGFVIDNEMFVLCVVGASSQSMFRLFTHGYDDV